MFNSSCSRKSWLLAKPYTKKQMLVARIDGLIKKELLATVTDKIYLAGSELCGVVIDGIVKRGEEFYLLLLVQSVDFNAKQLAQALMHNSASLSKQGNMTRKALFATVDGEHVIDYDEQAATMACDVLSVVSDDMPPKSESSECSSCAMRNLCHAVDMPELSCDTCANKGTSQCPMCNWLDMHIYHPQWMINAGFELVSVDHKKMVIEYDTFCSANHKAADSKKPVIKSHEFNKLWHNKLETDPFIMRMMHQFGAELVRYETDAS